MKLKRTLIAVLAIVLVFGAFALFDTVRAQTYTIEVVSLTPENPWRTCASRCRSNCASPKGQGRGGALAVRDLEKRRHV
ncbi:MAG: hypothetical protein ACLRTQ_02660 [Candidatus Borkfalkia sp.]